MFIRRIIRYLFKDKRQRALSKQPMYIQLEFSFMEFLASPLIQKEMKDLLKTGRISVRQHRIYLLLVDTVNLTNTMISTDSYIRAIYFDMEHHLEQFYKVYALLVKHIKKEYLFKLQWEYCNVRKII
nr:MAG: hypothetical protein [Enquatrovirus sp.]